MFTFKLFNVLGSHAVQYANAIGVDTVYEALNSDTNFTISVEVFQAKNKALSTFHFRIVVFLVNLQIKYEKMK